MNFLDLNYFQTTEKHQKQKHRCDITDDEEQHFINQLVEKCSFIVESFLNFSKTPYPADKERDEHSAQGKQQIGTIEHLLR